MPTYHYPVLLWRDAAKGTTAAVVGDFETVVANAATEAEALRQVKELLEWRFEHEPWDANPDLAEPNLIEVKVEVRPQYKVRNRIIPCAETVWLRVHCITGLQESGLRLCIVPHLSLRFSYQEAANLKSLVSHYVKECLQAFTPAQLALAIPPKECRLDNIVLRDSSNRARRVAPVDRPELKILFTVADPLLHDLSRKRTASAAYGRESLSSALADKLGREKANVLLVGAPGVGKSTVLLDAAKQLARQARHPSSHDSSDEDPSSDKELRTYRFWRGSAGRLIAGMRYLGEWQERCELFIEQLAAIDGVFCGENLLELLQVGGQGPADSVAAFLLPYLQRRELHLVAEATPEEVEACRRLLPGLLDNFQIIHVPLFDDATALQILQRVGAALAAGTKIELKPEVLPLVYRFHKRFQPYAAFPGSAANFVRTLFEKRPSNPKSNERVLTAQDVVSLFIKRTGLPEIFLRDELTLRLEEVHQRFAAEIIGQPQATLAAARVVTTIKSGLTDPARPFGVLLFCGPTGVGKTALAKTLTQYCFGTDKDRLVRLDMSEYYGAGATQRLLQNPQGQPAPWIERVRRQPFCVLLLDEIEKAEPEVFDALLGLLDEGRLTDRFGRVAWFRSAIIILTSNLGTNAPASAGFSEARVPVFESEVSRFFRPEFFNRLDAVITFRPLERGEVESIARKELAELAAREGFRSQGIRLLWTDRLVEAVAREGYDARFGARPLQRALERLVATPLARWKVAHPIVRDVVLHLDLDDNSGFRITLQDQAKNDPFGRDRIEPG